MDHDDIRDLRERLEQTEHMVVRATLRAERAEAERDALRAELDVLRLNAVNPEDDGA